MLTNNADALTIQLGDLQSVLEFYKQTGDLLPNGQPSNTFDLLFVRMAKLVANRRLSSLGEFSEIAETRYTAYCQGFDARFDVELIVKDVTDPSNPRWMEIRQVNSLDGAPPSTSSMLFLVLSERQFTGPVKINPPDGSRLPAFEPVEDTAISVEPVESA